MGVHLCGRCLQPRQNAESGLYASSFCISLGRSVSKRRKTGVWITKYPRKCSKLKPNSPAQVIRRGNSSHHPSFFRILLSRKLYLSGSQENNVEAYNDVPTQTPCRRTRG